MIMNKLCDRLKELREDKKISQVKLAKILKTTNSSICDWGGKTTLKKSLSLSPK